MVVNRVLQHRMSDLGSCVSHQGMRRIASLDHLSIKSLKRCGVRAKLAVADRKCHLNRVAKFIDDSVEFSRKRFELLARPYFISCELHEIPVIRCRDGEEFAFGRLIAFSKGGKWPATKGTSSEVGYDS